MSTACRTWQASTVAPPVLVNEEQPSQVRVTLRNGSVVVLERPAVRNDSLASAVDPGAGAALADVRTLEVRRLSLARSVGLAFVIVGIAASWTAVARGVSGGSAQGPPPLPK